MFRKVAIALIAASMLTAPVMAKAPAAATKPATTSTSTAAVKTIKAHGLDWTAYKARNLAETQNDKAKNAYIQRLAAYGDDCISGGAGWIDSA